MHGCAQAIYKFMLHFHGSGSMDRTHNTTEFNYCITKTPFNLICVDRLPGKIDWS